MLCTERYNESFSFTYLPTSRFVFFYDDVLLFYMYLQLLLDHSKYHNVRKSWIWSKDLAGNNGPTLLKAIRLEKRPPDVRGTHAHTPPFQLKREEHDEAVVPL